MSKLQSEKDHAVPMRNILQGENKDWNVWRPRIRPEALPPLRKTNGSSYYPFRLDFLRHRGPAKCRITW